MSVSQKRNKPAPETICLACGFCCNGVLFADLKLQPEDNARKLLALGLPLETTGQRRSRPGSAPGKKLPQPCAAFDGCRCSIYPDRPRYCRQFECLLLKRLKLGKTTRAKALQTILKAQCHVEEVLRLLRKLGNNDEQMPLADRFRHTTKQLENSVLDKKTAHLYGQLTTAMHTVNCFLSESFYP